MHYNRVCVHLQVITIAYWYTYQYPPSITYPRPHPSKLPVPSYLICGISTCIIHRSLNVCLVFIPPNITSWRENELCHCWNPWKGKNINYYHTGATWLWVPAKLSDQWIQWAHCLSPSLPSPLKCSLPHAWNVAQSFSRSLKKSVAPNQPWTVPTTISKGNPHSFSIPFSLWFSLSHITTWLLKFSLYTCMYPCCVQIIVWLCMIRTINVIQTTLLVHITDMNLVIARVFKWLMSWFATSCQLTAS